MTRLCRLMCGSAPRFRPAFDNEFGAAPQQLGIAQKSRWLTCRKAEGLPHIRRHSRRRWRGYGVHWPDLDEDIGVQGVLLGKRWSASPSSFERWLARRNEKLQRDSA